MKVLNKTMQDEIKHRKNVDLELESTKQENLRLERQSNEQSEKCDALDETRMDLEMKYKETLGISKENEAMAEKTKIELDNLEKKDLCLEKEKVTSIDFIKRLTNYDRGFQNRRLKKMIH